MRWQIAQFTFCDQQQSLTTSEGVVYLEPMMVELLSYFCQNVDEIVSKDQLIEQVWLGRTVSDNTVSKLITKLRKVLADDVRQPKFIATFPKKGYRFIATTILLPEPVLAINHQMRQVVIEHNINEIQQADIPPIDDLPFKKVAFVDFKRKKGWLIVSILFMLFLVLFGANLFQYSSTHKPFVSPVAKALTTDDGEELFPVFSPDGNYVAYMSAKKNRMHLIIKNVVSEQAIEINHEDGVGVGPASWSDDGTLIAYLVATPNRCQYYLRTIDKLSLGEPQLLHNCPAGSYGKIAFTHDNNRLVYSENDGSGTPYSLFEINLTTGAKKRLKQPDLYLGGNSQFDIHPKENKLLISSPDKQQWEGFYSLDLATEQLTLLFKQDAYICCGIWSHSGDRVVLMGEYPAYQLLSYDLKGKDRRIIFSGSRPIIAPARHTNGIDYLFTSGKSNRDISILNFSSGKKTVIANGSVDERLAVFSSNYDHIAYINLASGYEEVWLIDTKNIKRKKLTQFNDSRHYIDLRWSPHDKFILALTLNEIHLIDTITGKFDRLKISQTEIRGVSFKDENTISYSVKEGNRWRVYHYLRDKEQVVAADPKWQFIQYHSDSNNNIWLDQANQLYVGKDPQPVLIKAIVADNLINGRQFNLKKRGALWTWFDRREDGRINQYSETTDQVTTLIKTNVEHFDISTNQLLFGDIHQVNSDIYQTKYQKH